MSDQDEAPAPPFASYAPPSALDLDDLLAEIRHRASGASRSQTRLAALLDAVVAISSDLDLTLVLEHVLQSACTLLGARYGAIGVVDQAGGQLTRFVHHGLGPDVAADIGHLPHGDGVLGLLLEDPSPIRIDDISRHPGAVGFPPGHPPMRTFIGVPIRVRGQIFGNLYLTEKAGPGSFDADDEAVLVALAAAAGIAVDNAQLYRHARRSEEWSKAVGELSQTLLEGRNERSALARMVKSIRELADAQLCALLVGDSDGGVVVQASDTDGVGNDLRGRLLDDNRWRQLMEMRTPVLLRIEPDDEAGGELSDQLRLPAGFDRAASTVVVPIAVGEIELGLVVVSWGPDAPSDVNETMDLLTVFTDRMALAIEAARAQRHRQHAFLLEDRDRIARDMHDHVIQRLFAAGLTLQTAGRLSGEQMTDRIDFVVDELDLAVKDIRRAIFELHHGFPEGGLGPEIESVVEKATVSFGFVPDVAFEGRLSDIPEDIGIDVVAVVREALANIARHAKATDARIRVSNLGDELVVTIADNGVGLRDGGDRSGLANLAGRAARHGGTFDTRSSRENGGTVLRWAVPLDGGAELDERRQGWGA